MILIMHKFIIFAKTHNKGIGGHPDLQRSKIIHNKWMQASRKCNSDLFVSKCDDWVRAFVHMTNYRAYLCGGPSDKGPSRHELKLKRVVAFGDTKRIVETLCDMSGAKDIYTCVPHFKEEEVFGSMKRKLNLLIGSKGDSHRLDKVNFSHPRIQTIYVTTRVQL